MNRRNLFFLLGNLVWITSCTESSIVGEDFVESADYELALNTSIPVELSTVRFDSLVTSESDRLVVGGKQDTYFGDFNVESYFLLDLRQQSVNDQLRYDSITLNLPMDGYSAYLPDATIRETLVLEQLVDELEYLEDENALYNYSEIPGVTDQPGIPLAEGAFLLATDRIRELQLRLPDDYGEELFEKLRNSDEIFSNGAEANEYLKGFRLYMKDASFVFGLKQDSVRFTIHTTDVSSSSLSNTDFNFFIGSSPYYSKYVHSNVPEIIEVQELGDEIPSNLLDDQGYIIGGLGYATRVDLTGVRDLLLSGEEFILANAEIRLRWFEMEEVPHSDTLTANLVDQDYSRLTGNQAFILTSIYDDQYGRDNYYTMDLTQIADFILTQPFGGEYYLMLTTESFSSSPTQAILGDKSLGSEILIYTIQN